MCKGTPDKIIHDMYVFSLIHFLKGIWYWKFSEVIAFKVWVCDPDIIQLSPKPFFGFKL